MPYIEYMPGYNIPLIPNFLSVGEAIYAVLLTTIIFCAIKLYTRRRPVSYFPFDASSVSDELIKKIAADLSRDFPQRFMRFEGKAYESGVTLRVVTKNSQVIDGKFIGFDGNDAFCMVTNAGLMFKTFKEVTSLEKLDSGSRRG